MKPILEAHPREKINLPVILAVICILIVLVTGFINYTIELSNQNNASKSEQSFLTDSALHVPQFSHTSGFYNREFYLELKTPNRTDKIYYTTDGTTPTEDSEQYLKPILIKNRENEPNSISEIPTSREWKRPLYKVFKGTTIKVITVRSNRKSIESSNSFFVHFNGRKRYSLPVINLTIDIADLFDYRRGIYVMGATRDDKGFYIRNKIKDDSKWWRYPANYNRKGVTWERNVSINYFKPKSNEGFFEKARIRTHGNATRGFAQKSFRILFREKYGNKFLTYNIFGKQPYLPLPSFLLKGFGQDQIKALFRDNLMQALIANNKFNLNKQRFQPAILFINAEYWGIFSIQERLDAENISLKYYVPIDSLTVLGSLDMPEHGTIQDKKNFTEIEDFIKNNDLSLESNYNYVTGKIDIDNLLDYMIAHMYAANTDWPDFNFKEVWRYKGKKTTPHSVKDGRWRWLLSDLDLGFGGKGTFSQNMVSHILESKSLGPVFSSLLKNAEFQRKFFSRFDYHLNNTFETKNVLSKIDELERVFEPEISEHINRWRTIDSYKAWKTEVELLREFARRRNAYQIQELEYLRKQLKNIKS